MPCPHALGGKRDHLSEERSGLGGTKPGKRRKKRKARKNDGLPPIQCYLLRHSAGREGMHGRRKIM